MGRKTERAPTSRSVLRLRWCLCGTARRWCTKVGDSERYTRRRTKRQLDSLVALLVGADD